MLQTRRSEAAQRRGEPIVALATLPRLSVARDEHVLDLCEGMIDIAAALFNVSGRDLRHPGRSSQSVARVRQIAMYVAHVVLGLTMLEVGRGFGRDRTTVLHACHLIEDMREDEEFDGIVAMIERVAGAALRPRCRGR